MAFTTHQSIVDRLRDEGNNTWENFYSYYFKLIRLHGKDCGIKEGQLDDLVQEVMISVARISKSFIYDPEKGRFRDFLKKIIRARAVDLLRRYYSKESMFVYLHDDMSRIKSLPCEAVPEEEILDQEYYDKWRNIFIRNCLKMLKSKLKPQHYQIYHMLEYQNISVQEVAAFTGLSPVSVYSIRSRIESRLSAIARELAVQLPPEAVTWEIGEKKKRNRCKRQSR